MKNFVKGIFKKKPSPPEDSVSGYLNAISKWLENKASPIRAHLNSGATASEISQVESELKIEIPASIREAYLIHNGEKSDSDGIFGLWRWLSLDDMKKEFYRIKEETHSDSVRIPLLRSPGGDILYAESGPESEIIEWWHERPSRDVKHPHFKAYLKWFSTKLYQGDYVFLADEMSGLVDKSEL